MTQTSAERYQKHLEAQEAYKAAKEQRDAEYVAELERLRQRPPVPTSGTVAQSAHAAWDAVYAPSREQLFSEKTQMQARRERNANAPSWAAQMRQAKGAKGEQERIERSVNPEDYVEV